MLSAPNCFRGSIKASDLQHEVLIKRTFFQVPGSSWWWGKECPGDEHGKLLMCQVVEAELTHHFQGVAMRQPALRFKLLGAAASSTVDDSPLWIGVLRSTASWRMTCARRGRRRQQKQRRRRRWPLVESRRSRPVWGGGRRC